MSGALIAGGKRLKLDPKFTVRTWEETGLEYRGLRPREETRHGVIHYTQGPHLAPVMFRNLARRLNRFGRPAKLSVHFCVNPDGTIYQFCDADMRCSHAGTVDDSDGDGHEPSANQWSWGIEVVNPATIFDTAEPPAMVTLAGVERSVLRETIHGLEHARTTFTAQQTEAVLEMVRVLCAHYQLPVAVPMEHGDVVARVLREEEFAAFRGVLPHYALKRDKFDPGIAPMRAIAALAFRGKDGAAE